MVAPPGDRKPLVLSTYLDAQEHLPYADDSNAVTPMSEENGAMVVPMYYASLGIGIVPSFSTILISQCKKGSRHSSYTSHASRMSYTSHGDLLGGLGGNGKEKTKERQLRERSMRNGPTATSNFTEFTHKAHRGDYVSKCKNASPIFKTQTTQQDGPTGALHEGKLKHLDNPFIDSNQKQTMVDMKGMLKQVARTELGY